MDSNNNGNTTITEGDTELFIPDQLDGDSPADETPSANEESTEANNFDSMNLDDKLLRGIYAYGFDKPSPIQQKAIIPMYSGRDIIGQAQSGTGKTGAFVIGMLQRLAMLNANAPTNQSSFRECKAVILSPTRDLSDQIYSVVEGLSSYMNIKCLKCIGGNDWKTNVRDLQRGCDVIIGTPGRVYDMLQRKALDGFKLESFILDEADEMLDIRGFQDKVYDILQLVNTNAQICLFSATIPQPVLELTEKFMRNPTQILVKTEQLTLEGIRQFYVGVEHEDWKLDTICDLYKTISITSCVIFCNTKKKVDWLSNELTKRDYAVEAIHGALTPLDRTEILKKFRKGDCRVLVTTDLLARGIDVQHVSIVINYDLPTNLENYLHRIGRSGRYGRKGLAINFVKNDDVQLLKDIERFYDTIVEELPRDIDALL